MKIQSVRIQNFRTLKDVTIPFDSVTTFIGPNGAGKSTVLRALDWFFNGKPGSLTEKDCSFGAVDQDIQVQVTFAGLTEKDREALGKYTPEGAPTFTAWKKLAPSGAEMLSANAKSFPDFNPIKAATTATAKKELYAALKLQRPDLNLEAATTGTAVEQAMTAWEASHTDQLVDAPDVLQTNFFGFNSGGKMSGLFDFVLVTADLRASEESVDGKSSIIGRILERSVDRAAADVAIAEIVAESRVKQQKVYEETFKDQLVAITTKLNEVVASYSPGRTVTVAPTEIELKAPRTTFDVAVLDGPTETAVERQGHGFQRTILISALQLLAQSGSASAEGVICLAIEEPELFQHPIQAQAFAKVLRSLAEDTEKRIQVTYATHSPYFLEARYFHQVRRLTRSTDETPTVTVHYANVEQIKEKLKGVIKLASVDRQLDNTVTSQLAIALFSNRVFLVEGTTESAIFYGVGDRSLPGSLEASGIAIVAVGGKTSIPLAHAIVSSLEIPVYSLFDADGGFEIRARTNGKSEEKIQEEKAAHISANRTMLRYFGLPEEDFPNAVVSDQVAILYDQLESFMSDKWNEWVAACKQVEDESEISLSKNSLAYRTATLKAEGVVPEMLVQVLSKVKGQ
jgi:predicted ATP-dependent endonuclease of OLD family